MKPRLSPQAASDLEEIWYHATLETASPEVADRLIDTITHRFALLASHPYLGRSRDQDLGPGLRSFPIGNYVIFYRLDDEAVLILRVLRGSRNIQALFET